MFLHSQSLSYCLLIASFVNGRESVLKYILHGSMCLTILRIHDHGRSGPYWNRVAISLLNLLLIWTIIDWIVALIWSATYKRRA